MFDQNSKMSFVYDIIYNNYLGFGKDTDSLNKPNNSYYDKKSFFDSHLLTDNKNEDLFSYLPESSTAGTLDTDTPPSATPTSDMSEVLKVIQYLEQGAYHSHSLRRYALLSASSFLPLLSASSPTFVRIPVTQPSDRLNTKRLQLHRTGRSIEKQHDEYIIYRSKKGNDSVHLNGQALSTDGNPIFCRHLAYYVIQSQIKGYHDSLSSIEEIQKIPSLMSLDFDTQRKKYLAEHYIFTNTAMFGETLYELTSNLKHSESTNFLVLSENHMMGLNIKRHEDSYKIKFYDPNYTNTHICGVFLNRDILKSLRLDAFMPRAMVDYYWKKSSALTLMSYDKGRYESKIVVRHLIYDMTWLIQLLLRGIGLDNLSSLITEKKESSDPMAVSAATYCSPSGPGMFTVPRLQLNQEKSYEHVPMIKY